MKMPAGKVPQIPLPKAYQKYLQQRRDRVKGGVLSPDEGATETDEATAEMCAAFKRGDLVAEVFDGDREFRLTTYQWEEAFFPERLFLAGAIAEPNGSFSDYKGLHPYTDEVMFNRWLAGAFREGSKATKTHPRDGDQQLKKRITAVLSYARERWRMRTKRPPFRQMAVDIKSQKKDQGFSPESLRQILAGRYSVMERIGLKGIDG